MATKKPFRQNAGQTKPPAKSALGVRPETAQAVSVAWLVSGIGIVLAMAAVCGYGALCLLFWQGQWQMLFQPSRTITATPASAGMAFDDIRFDYTETGQAQLDGWWIPAADAHGTVLYLHGGKGSLSDTVAGLQALHSLGVNVFAFDYRGFGKSAGAHPTERTANEDATAAWAYLTDTRHLPIPTIAVYGTGTGAVFAAALGAGHPPAALILEDIAPSASAVFDADARARIMPLFLLQNETLDPTTALAAIGAPKLFLDRSAGAHARTAALFAKAAYRKSYFDLRGTSQDAWAASMRRFLDENLLSGAGQ